MFRVLGFRVFGFWGHPGAYKQLTLLALLFLSPLVHAFRQVGWLGFKRRCVFSRVCGLGFKVQGSSRVCASGLGLEGGVRAASHFCRWILDGAFLAKASLSLLQNSESHTKFLTVNPTPIYTLP